MPTFLPPPRPTKEEITAIDIEACFQEYRNLRGDIHERRYLQEYIVTYGFTHKKENVKSLKKNDPTCQNSKDLSFPINEEGINTFMDIIWNMWKKFCYKGDEKRLYKKLNEEIYIHEVENQSPQCGCKEEHQEEGEEKHTILADGCCENQRESTNGSLKYEGVPTDGCS